MIEQYVKQVRLLVNVLPYIAKESCFALKGGTAINLFVRDLPRLSVDIDLAYLGFEERETAFKNINAALQRIVNDLNKVHLRAVLQKSPDNICKIICSNAETTIKIEPNYTIRGYVYPTEKLSISEKVQEKYGFAAINVVSMAELYGGKICAALDRQHPRDLFDIKYLLGNEGITPEIKNGFMVSLLQHNRPPHELLAPHKQDNTKVFEQEFKGMSDEIFTIENCNNTFDILLSQIKQALTAADKQFLIDFFSLNEAWKNTDIPNIDKLSGIKWKIENLTKLRNSNQEKFANQIALLKQVIDL